MRTVELKSLQGMISIFSQWSKLLCKLWNQHFSFNSFELTKQYSYLLLSCTTCHLSRLYFKTYSCFNNKIFFHIWKFVLNHKQIMDKSLNSWVRNIILSRNCHLQFFNFKKFTTYWCSVRNVSSCPVAYQHFSCVLYLFCVCRCRLSVS